MSSATEHFNKTAESYEAATGGATRELGEHAISLMTDVKPLTSESRILDNACGTGVVTDMILQSAADANMQTRDPRRRRRGKDGGRGQAPVPIRRLPLAPQQGPRGRHEGREAPFPRRQLHPLPSPASGSCSSPTPARARGEIARTLRPDGGVAVVTGWAAMGHVDVHPRGPGADPAPTTPPFEPPFSRRLAGPGAHRGRAGGRRARTCRRAPASTCTWAARRPRGSPVF
ncbi:hypothetical protein C8034_v008255 [Colletotrichum sidae]|uniref:Methyltransferase domain-containing protein n=1 Tax=Colletotrichum sidae TaxID=1347389 RepID=A0A4R8T2R7_9PEZI|nr:hypothetical protein C8034_v008255 [Colletotrichum sidae]